MCCDIPLIIILRNFNVMYYDLPTVTTSGEASLYLYWVLLLKQGRKHSIKKVYALELTISVIYVSFMPFQKFYSL